MTKLTQLIYSSRPFGFDEAMLNGILIDAQRKNDQNGVTGALLCRPDIYLQLLEGDKTAVHAIYKSIAVDDRHVEVKMRVSQGVDERLFPDWAMFHQADPLIWSPDEIHDGALDRASPADFQAVFQTVAAKAKLESA